MNLAEDLALLEAACRAGGAIARRRFEQGCKSWSKQGGSPVTEADLEVDAHLKAVLTAARPEYGWLSEESVDDKTRLSHDTLFIVDPIDGTVAFLKGRPHFTICAAVVRDGAAVAAWSTIPCSIISTRPLQGAAPGATARRSMSARPAASPAAPCWATAPC